MRAVEAAASTRRTRRPRRESRPGKPRHGGRPRGRCSSADVGCAAEAVAAEGRQCRDRGGAGCVLAQNRDTAAGARRSCKPRPASRRACRPCPSSRRLPAPPCPACRPSPSAARASRTGGRPSPRPAARVMPPVAGAPAAPACRPSRRKLQSGAGRAVPRSPADRLEHAVAARQMHAVDRQGHVRRALAVGDNEGDRLLAGRHAGIGRGRHRRRSRSWPRGPRRRSADR